MAKFEMDEKSKLPETHGQPSHEPEDSKFQKVAYRTRSASMSNAMVTMEQHDRESSLVGHTGPLRSERKTRFVQMSGPINHTRGTENILLQKVMFPVLNGKSENHGNNNRKRENEHLLKSGQLGMCNDPYCTTCPTYFKASQKINPKPLPMFDPKFHNVLYGDAKGFWRKFYSFCSSYVPGVMNPHAKVVQQWNKVLGIFCLFAIFLDPLFFFLLYVNEENKCIDINPTMTKILVVLRSINDTVYLMNILLQFRLAYVSPESTVVGAGDLIDHPKEIALHYLLGYFPLDLFVVIPLPQIIILFVIPNYLGVSGVNYAKNTLRVSILVQYIPRLFRFLPLLFGQSQARFVYESAWSNFVINLLICLLSGHIVGSCWYLFGLQRVNQCLRDACHKANIPECMKIIDCGYYRNEDHEPNAILDPWQNITDANNCLDPSTKVFNYGIYVNAVPLTMETNVINKYVYSLFWGFQQISTLAGNLTPSYFVWEVLFTMGIIGSGLLLFALLIGNIQNFLQALGRRRLEMQLRGRDVEQWMHHRRLPEDLKRKVRQAERYSWAATRGVNEEMLLQNLPEDLQRDIRRHLFKFVTKIRIFALMDEPILDAICERLRQKTYIKRSTVLCRGGLVEKMVFIVRGKLESIGEDGIGIPLSEGDVCGEELLTWYLEHSSVSTGGKKVGRSGQALISNRTVRCLTNVEAFSLRAADLEEVTTLFTRFLRSPIVQGALRYESHYWRSLAATRIQVAWRYRKRRISRVNNSPIRTGI